MSRTATYIASVPGITAVYDENLNVIGDVTIATFDHVYVVAVDHVTVGRISFLGRDGREEAEALLAKRLRVDLATLAQHPHVAVTLTA